MRRVAAELGLQAASLYWHVRNKEELLELLANAALAGMDLSVSEGTWREQAWVLAHRYRALLKSRRGRPTPDRGPLRRRAPCLDDDGARARGVP